MKRKIIYIIILLPFILLLSCKKDWLEKKRNISLVVPTTLQDLRVLMNNTSVFINEATGIGELSADDYDINESQFAILSSSNVLKGAITWSKGMFEDGSNSIDWTNAYQQVFYANVVLEALEKITPTINELEEYNDIKGNALFHRARSFYYIAQQFCKPYNSATAKTDQGVPLRLTSDINAITSRATLQQSYDQILGDLIIAAGLVKQTAKAKTDASQAGVYGYLARICLSIEDYENANKYADLCLQQQGVLLDFNVLNAAATYPIAALNNEVIYQSSVTNYGQIASVNVKQELYNSYSTNDLRRTIFFKFRTDGTVRFYGSYNGTAAPFGGLAVNEIYLIRAECRARNSDAINAIADINSLLIKRFRTGTFVPIVATNPKTALDIVLTERRKELLYRGIRWSDLRRLNKDPDYAITLTRVLGGITYTLPPNDPRYTLPIPLKVISESGVQPND